MESGIPFTKWRMNEAGPAPQRCRVSAPSSVGVEGKVAEGLGLDWWPRRLPLPGGARVAECSEVAVGPETAEARPACAPHTHTRARVLVRALPTPGGRESDLPAGRVSVPVRGRPGPRTPYSLPGGPCRPLVPLAHRKQLLMESGPCRATPALEQGARARAAQEVATGKHRRSALPGPADHSPPCRRAGLRLDVPPRRGLPGARRRLRL